MIAVGLCVDRAYLVPALVTLVSMADSHDAATRHGMSIRLLSSDITMSQACTFETITRKLGFKSFHCRRVVPAPHLKIVHGSYISRATYLRFAFNNSFVREPYFLYLDADMLVMGDMTEPFNDLRDGVVGVVRDEINHTVGFGPALPGWVRNRPQFRGEAYFNAGALWLSSTSLNAVGAGAQQMAIRFREHIHFNDQDALNLWLLLSRSSRELSNRFNRLELGRLREQSDWINRVVRNVGISSSTETTALHFIGPLKPWFRKCPGVYGVKLYASELRATQRLINRARDLNMDLRR